MRCTLTKHGENEYRVTNKKKELLGFISYYKSWKCWTWEQEECIMMSEDCLQEVINFLKKLGEGK